MASARKAGHGRSSRAPVELRGMPATRGSQLQLEEILRADDEDIDVLVSGHGGDEFVVIPGVRPEVVTRFERDVDIVTGVQRR
jgi:hypothetical protein